MNKAMKWAEAKARVGVTVARDRRLRREARAELVAMSLRQLREEAGHTQVEMAELTELTQATVSRMERKQDNPIDTVRKYVEALGGEVEVVAVLGNKRVTLLGV